MFNCKICNKSAGLNDKCVKVESTDLDSSKNWTCTDCEVASLPAKETSSMIDLLRALAEDVKEMKPKFQSIDGLEIKQTLHKQPDLSFEDMERLQKVETLLEEQKCQLEKLTLENISLKSKISDLEYRLNHAEQNQLSNTIEIRGIPEKSGETVVGTILSVGAALGVKLSPDDLDYVVRLRPKQEGTPGPIIVRFVRQTLRDELIRQRKTKRDFSTRHLGWTDNELHRVFVSEAMTLTNKYLYWLAKKNATEFIDGFPEEAENSEINEAPFNCNKDKDDRPSYEWKRVIWPTNSLPTNVVVGGIDSTHVGGKLYVGRAWYKGNLLPAKVCASDGRAFVSYQDSEVMLNESEVLCTEHAIWKPIKETRIPTSALPVGNTEKGEPLYMGRWFVDLRLTPGKVESSSKILQMTYGNRVYRSSQYEILIIKSGNDF